MNEQKNNTPKKPLKNPFVLFLVLSIIATLGLNTVMAMLTAPEKKEISYDEFLKLVNEKKIEKVEINPPNIAIFPIEEKKEKKGDSITDFLQFNPFQTEERKAVYYTGYLDDEQLIPLLNKNNIKFERPVSDNNPIIDFFVAWIMPLLILYLIFFVFARYISKKMGGGGIMGIGQSNAKVYMENKTGITFADVAGQEEAKESLNEIVDFLHNPKKYTQIGAKQPKGALLVGPPGTGKTLLAKAVAGEANVPFFSLSGSEFVEMFVGVGASRVRNLFKDAAAKAPCIIFIDEIDAIGKSRDSQLNSNDEREQTLNQLLAEMDGFDSSKGVVILAATNRPEILDKALLRPGRFDRRIIVEKPDLKGREAILHVHAKNVILGDDVDLHEMALSTSGAVGADLANMINEAALHAVRMGRTKVSQADLMEAVEVIIAGKEKKDRILSHKEKRIVAFHEVGHALATAIQKNTDPVQKITIVPRTMGALGYTMQVPEEEKYLMSKDEILDQITVYLAGRCAEEIIFNTKTTGASNDIEQATNLARAMIAQYGMSDKFGMTGLVSIEQRYLDGRAVSNCSEETKTQIDNEVVMVLSQCHEKATKILTENIDALNEISEFLIKKETITGTEFMKILNRIRKTKVAIFDLDGTVSDTIDSIAYFGNYALTENGFAPHETNKYKYFAGDGRDTLLHRMLAEHSADTPDNFEKVKKTYDAAYEADVMRELKMFDGIHDTINKLKENGCICAILSNKPDNVVKDIIKSSFDESAFNIVVGQTDDRALKPNPDGINYILKTLSVDKESAWMIGDTNVDINTGKNAGVSTIGVLWGFRTENELSEAGADNIVSTPGEIVDIICK